MKKIFIFLISIICISASLYAQPGVDDGDGKGGQRMEKIKALYAAYITQQLSLTPEEAQKFWPVHAQYDAEIMQINRSGLQEIEREEAVIKVKRKYAASFTKILGAERYNTFNIKDEAFRNKIKARLKEMKQRREGAGKGKKEKIDL